MKDLLLIEDNLELAAILSEFLRKDGYSLFHAVTGEEGVNYLKEHMVKLVLLDLMLPNIDGFGVCEEIRKISNVPIIITSAKVDKSDKITSLSLGADDYVEKPFDLDVLLAKIKAGIRRSYSMKEEAKILVDGNLTVNLSTRMVYLEGKEVVMTSKEYELLVLFLKSPNKSLRKEWMFDEVWGADSFSEFSTLTVHINKLREKIEENPKKPKRIKTVWGVGYKYETNQ